MVHLEKIIHLQPRSRQHREKPDVIRSCVLPCKEGIPSPTRSAHVRHERRERRRDLFPVKAGAGRVAQERRFLRDRLGLEVVRVR